MSNLDGFHIVDNALSLAVDDLKERGLPEDEAYIAMLIRLKCLVPEDVQKVADLLTDDDELNAKINPDRNSTDLVSAGT